MNEIDIKTTGIKNTSYSVANPKDNYYKQQRVSRGFDDTELWSLDVTLAKFLLPRLQRFLVMDNKGREFHKEQILDFKKIQAMLMIMVSDDYYLPSDEQLQILEEGKAVFGKRLFELWT